MGKSKTKPAKQEQEQAEEKDKVRYLPVLRMPSEWRVGDQIVTSTNKFGYVSASTKITHIETGEGCKNLHVNRNSCYDRSVAFPIAVEEQAALMELAGISPADLLEMILEDSA